jgi:serine/threonine-protein kinase
VVLHEMLAGAPPFDGETLPQVCARVMSEPPPPLQERAPGLPPALYEIVNRCLQKQPAARFQSVAELAHALEPIATGRGRQSIERISRVLGVTPSSPQPIAQLPVAATTADPILGTGSHVGGIGTQANWGDTRPKPPGRRRAAPVLLGSLAFLAVAGTGAWLALRAPSVAAELEPAPSAAGSPPQLGVPAVIEPVAPAPVSAPVAPAPSASAVAEPPAPPSPAPPARPRAGQRPAAKPAAEVVAKPAAAAPPAAPAPAAPASPPATSTRSRL